MGKISIGVNGFDRVDFNADGSSLFRGPITVGNTNLGKLSFNNLTDNRDYEFPDSSGTLSTLENFKFIQSFSPTNNPTFTSIVPSISYTDENDVICEIEDGDNSNNEYRFELPDPTGNGYRVLHTLFYKGSGNFLYKIIGEESAGTWTYINKTNSSLDPNNAGIIFIGGSSASDVNIYDILITVREAHGTIYCTMEYNSTI